MRSAVVFALLCTTATAYAEPKILATNGAWLTLSAENGPVKGCGVQAAVNGGKFTIEGTTDRQGILTLLLSKMSWKIPNIPVPIVLTFQDGEVIKLAGTGINTRISADLPADTVRPFLHYFTAQDGVVLTLPEGHEAPWNLDLHGTTPAVLAMAQCVDTAQLMLPPPFRPPVPQQHLPADQTPSLNETTPSEKTTSVRDQVPSPGPVAATPVPGPVPEKDAQAQPPAATETASPDTRPRSGSTSGLEEHVPPEPAVSGSYGPTILVGLALVSGILWIVLQSRATAQKRARLYREIDKEIEHNSQALYVKRRQTVYKDDYGTMQFTKWLEAKSYYISTRIAPIVNACGYPTFPEGLKNQVEKMVEEAANKPLPDGIEFPEAYVSSPDFYDARMHPVDYESFCAMQLQRAGWDARTTVATGDQGADVIAKQAGKVLVLQCKLYSSAIGNDAVQQVLAARTFQSANIAAVVSNQPYTRSAKQLAAISRVYLLHHDELATFRPPEVVNAL